MREHDSRAPSATKMIAWTAVAAVLCWGATLSMVRAVAQESGPPRSAPPGASTEAPSPDAGPTATPPATVGGPVTDDDSNEETASDRARAPVTLDELPEFRDSADNNISLPVDI